MIWQELRTGLDAHRPQKMQLSTAVNDLLVARPNDVKLRGRMERIEVDWAHMESSVDACERQLTDVQTVLLPSMQAAHELTVWMDGVEQTVEVESSIQPKNANDIEQLHDKFKVEHYCYVSHAFILAFNALALLVRHQEEHLARKN